MKWEFFFKVISENIKYTAHFCSYATVENFANVAASVRPFLLVEARYSRVRLISLKISTGRPDSAIEQPN